MRIKAEFIALLVLVSTAAMPVSAAGGGTGEAVYINSSELLDGFTYTNEISYNVLNNREEAFMLSVSPKSAVYPVFMPCKNVYGGMTLTQAIEYYESLGKTVVGGVNSDFFYSKNQMPLGISIENGIFKSSPEDENILAIDENGVFFLGKTEIKLTLTINKNGSTVTLKHYNKARNDGGGLYLLTDDFSDTTHTSSKGWAVRFNVVEGEYRLGSTVTYEVEAVIPEGQNYKIGENQAVLTCDETSMRDSVREKFEVGDRVTLSFECADERLVGAVQATGCGDLLVDEGEITDSKAWDEAITSTNPRTAVGVTYDGTILLYALDGKTSGYSTGANMQNLAKDMKSKNVRFAVNLDGGGSTTFAVKRPGDKTATVVNRPSGGTERSCGAFILLVTDNKKSDAPSRVFLKQDGINLLRGASISLDSIFTDECLNAVEANEILFASSSGLGTVSEMVYTAGMTEGVDRLTLSTPSGIVGTASIHVVSEKSVDFTLLDNVTGKVPTLTGLEEGTELSFTAKLKRYGRDVYFNDSAIKVSVSDSVGFVDEEGYITVTGLPGAEGTLTVSLGELRKTYKTNIYCTFSDIRAHWSSRYVESLYREGIVSGTGDGKFSPNQSLKRCDFVVMLWRAMGKPEPQSLDGFSDVQQNAYYAAAVNWACEQGITKGTGSGKFSPGGTLTREQAFTLIYRAYFYDRDASDTSALERFTDAGSVSKFALKAVASLADMGIISGSGGKLNPKAMISRAQIAKLLCESIYYDYSSSIAVG